MNNKFFPIERLRLFAADGQVYRSFHRLIASRMGTLLLVPMHLVTGRCDEVVDGCPVPWEEVQAVLEHPAVNPLTHPSCWNVDDHIQQLEYLGLDPEACDMDYITPMVNGTRKVLRMVHPCGVRYAVVIN